jgi:hypothetical protein
VNLLRRLVAAVALLVPAAVLGWLCLVHGALDTPTVLAAATIALAAGLVAAPFLTGQVFARGVAWLVLVVGVFGRDADGRASVPALLLAASAALALALARPELDAACARAHFAPTALRGAFLAASTASAACTVASACLAIVAFAFHPVPGVVLAAVAGALAASVVGVLRMRAWGVLLAAATMTIAALAGVTGYLDTPLHALMAPGEFDGSPFFVIGCGVPGVAAFLFVAVTLAARWSPNALLRARWPSGLASLFASLVLLSVGVWWLRD